MKALVVIPMALLLWAPQPAAAHCDTLKGPVVTAARAALEAGNPALVLHWVRAEDEAAVRSAFGQAVAVRGLGPQARDLADRYFFETVVRLHRAGEGAPYTGLSDTDPDDVVSAVDRAVATGSKEGLQNLLLESVNANLERGLAAAVAAKGFGAGDVRGGRAFVAAYVSLAHWAEDVVRAARGGGEHESHEAQGGAPPHP
ncbi:MAG TPA: DUF6448 family protein [Candidatus Polarisedimenticolaceae bacterium]|nr:DUF6448 family protein [Candidatus Polarisedimenticolaceae bacterium]